MRYLWGLCVGAALLLLILVGSTPPPARVAAGPLAQDTATPTPTSTPTATPTPRAAPAWERTDHPDNVRCYIAYLNGQPYGGCVVVP